MNQCEFLEPATLEEALTLLHKLGGGARVLAGGTDLVVRVREKRTAPRHVVNLGNIQTLRGICFDEARGLVIKPLTTIRHIELSPDVPGEYDIIRQAARELADPAIRNMATVGGNICNAAPSADMVPPLIALAASAKLVSISGERTVPVEELFTGPYTTTISDGELLVEVLVPPPSVHTAGIYLKHHTRGPKGLGSVGVALALTKIPNKRSVSAARIVLSAVSPTPMRARGAESMLINRTITRHVIKSAASMASDETHPRDSFRGSSAYKKILVKNLVEDGLSHVLHIMKAMN